jgi:hypothetical protein
VWLIWDGSWGSSRNGRGRVMLRVMSGWKFSNKNLPSELFSVPHASQFHSSLGGTPGIALGAAPGDALGDALGVACCPLELLSPLKRTGKVNKQHGPPNSTSQPMRGRSL